MVPDRAFFAVQRRFADRWAMVASIPVETAYLEVTTWYRQAAGLDRDFDPAHPAWLRLLHEISHADEPEAVVHAWALANERPMGPGPVLDSSWSPEDRTVRLHFIGERSPERSPLGRAQLRNRRRELRSLVLREAEAHPDAAWLRGRSWLYGLEAYRRIFPTLLLEGLGVERPDLQFLACWGQLLDRHWQLKPDMAARLLDRVDGATTVEELEAAFPFPMLETRAPLNEVALLVASHG